MYKRIFIDLRLFCCLLLIARALAWAISPAQATASTPPRLMYAPILMYHHVGNPRAGRFNVTLENFRTQMQWLHDNGYETVSVDAIAAALRGEGTLPAKPVAITFDDGWKNQLNNALPILNAFGFKATFYIVGRWANSNSPVLMNWKDVQSLQVQGHWIASHSLSHKTETRLRSAALWQEIVGGRDMIAQAISQTATTYAYPGGAVNNFVEGFTRKAGYTAAVGVPSNCDQQTDGVFRMNRIEVRNGYSMAAFTGWLTCRPLPLPKPRLQKPTPILAALQPGD